MVIVESNGHVLTVPLLLVRGKDMVSESRVTVMALEVLESNGYGVSE
jgi:hypothetical protein